MRAILTMAVIGLVAAAASADFVNPGFETGDASGWSASASVSVNAADAYEGSFGANLPSGTYISQNLYSQLQPDTQYTVSAWMRINSIAPDSATWGNVYLRAGEWPDLGNNVFAGNGFGPDRNIIGEWQYVEGTWTSPSDLTTLAGTDVFNVGVRQFGISADVSVDNLQFVPEPATLSILGLGALGLLRRRR